LEITLNKLQPGEKGKIIKVAGEKAIKRKLYDMGVTPGTELVLRKVAPLGDPIEINIRGYSLSLRKAEAETIIIEKKVWTI